MLSIYMYTVVALRNKASAAESLYVLIVIA